MEITNSLEVSIRTAIPNKEEGLYVVRFRYNRLLTRTKRDFIIGTDYGLITVSAVKITKSSTVVRDKARNKEIVIIYYGTANSLCEHLEMEELLLTPRIGSKRPPMTDHERPIVSIEQWEVLMKPMIRNIPTNVTDFVKSIIVDGIEVNKQRANIHINSNMFIIDVNEIRE